MTRRDSKGPGPGGAEPRRGGAQPGPGGHPRNRRPASSYDAEEKRRLLDAFEASGQGMREWCLAQGLSTTTLCAWRRAVAQRGAAGLEARPNPRNAKGKRSPPHSPEARRKAVEAFSGGTMTRADFARVWGISETTLQGWMKSYRAKGPKGLEQPYGTGKKKGPPKRPLSPALKGEITRVLQRFPYFGLKRVRDFLKRFRGVAADTRVVRRTMEEEKIPRAVAPKRRRRAKPKVRRFERARPGELWQTDITSFLLPRHKQRVYVTVFLDDFSRYVVAWNLQTSQRAELVVEALQEGIARFGRPKEVLTDQGRQYYSWRGKCDFQKLLDREGIRHVVARAHHPQTVGKCERLWETLGTEWWDRARPQDVAEARERLGHYFGHYNHFRPHQGIDGLVPADRFFGAAETVRKTIEARLQENELALAVGEKPRTPVLLYGQVGERQVSLHGEGGRLVIQTADGVREEMGIEDLGAPDWRQEDKRHDDDGGDDDKSRGDEADAALQEAGALPEGAPDARAGEGALGGRDGGGPEAGPRDVRGDAGALGGEDRPLGGGGAAEGAAAAGVATLPAGGGGDGGGAAEATAPEEGGSCNRARRAEGPQEEDRAAGEGAEAVAGPPLPAARPAGTPGDAPAGGGEGCSQEAAGPEGEDAPRRSSGNGSESNSGGVR